MPTKRNKLYRRKTQKRQKGGTCTSAPSPITISIPLVYTYAGQYFNNPVAFNAISRALIEWTGGDGATSLTYTFAYGSQPDYNGNQSGTIPINTPNKSFYVHCLYPHSDYRLIITASCGNLSTVSTNSVPFRTPLPGTYTRTVIAGLSGTTEELTNATTTPTNNPLSTNFQLMNDITLDKYGNLYISSFSCILKMTPPQNKEYVMVGSVPTLISPPRHTSGSLISLYAGSPTIADIITTSSGDNIRFSHISGMAYDPKSDCIYVSTNRHQVAKVYTDSAGVRQCVLYAGGTSGGYSTSIANGPAVKPEGTLYVPLGLTVTSDGTLYIADSGNNRICKVKDGFMTTVVSDIASPTGVAIHSSGTIYSASNQHCVYRSVPNATGTGYTSIVYSGQYTIPWNAENFLMRDCNFRNPAKIWLDSQDNLYIYDAGNSQIRLIPLAAERLTTLFNGLNSGSVDGQGKFYGIAVDAFDTLYYCEAGSGVICKAIYSPATPVAAVTEATYNAYWGARRASSAIAQVASSAVAQEASGVQASSAIAQVASSAVAQVASSAVASSAKAQQASSAIAQVASSAVAQGVSSAVASSAKAQVISGAQESSATAQGASSATAQVASSAVAQGISGARESSATIQRTSSATAQVASSALAQVISGAEESSAIIQRASSATAQVASSAVAQEESSPIAYAASSAQESSATAQAASSAVLQTALIEPVAAKDAIVADLQGIQAYLNSVISVLYSKEASASDIRDAKDAVRGSLAPLKEQLAKLTTASNTIFAIAPLYQDRAVQTVVSTPLLEALGYMRIYDTMRGYHIAIDSNGYIVPHIDDLSTRGALSPFYVTRLAV